MKKILFISVTVFSTLFLSNCGETALTIIPITWGNSTSDIDDCYGTIQYRKGVSSVNPPAGFEDKKWLFKVSAPQNMLQTGATQLNTWTTGFALSTMPTLQKPELEMFPSTVSNWNNIALGDCGNSTWGVQSAYDSQGTMKIRVTSTQAISGGRTKYNYEAKLENLAFNVDASYQVTIPSTTFSSLQATY